MLCSLLKVVVDTTETCRNVVWLLKYIVLDQPVDSSLVEMRSTHSIVDFVDIYCLVEIRHRDLPTKQQTL
jgi:hypothetical protein